VALEKGLPENEVAYMLGLVNDVVERELRLEQFLDNFK
jgi:hypothetical protein